jgi:hypothetical protein
MTNSKRRPRPFRPRDGEMGPLVDRTEFRAILKEVVKCVRQHLDVPGLRPLDPHQLASWFGNITLEDLQCVVQEIDREG